MNTLKRSTLIYAETGFSTSLYFVTWIEMTGVCWCLIFTKHVYLPHQNKALLYDVNDRQFDDISVIIIRGQCIHPFFLKDGDYVNDQPNDNGINCKFKASYNKSRAYVNYHFGTMKLSPSLMSSVLLASWGKWISNFPSLERNVSKNQIYFLSNFLIIRHLLPIPVQPIHNYFKDTSQKNSHHFKVIYGASL